MQIRKYPFFVMLPHALFGEFDFGAYTNPVFAATRNRPAVIRSMIIWSRIWILPNAQIIGEKLNVLFDLPVDDKLFHEKRNTRFSALILD